MTREEIAKKVKWATDLDRQARRKLLIQLSNLLADELEPLREACSKLGHLPEQHGTNIFGEPLFRCSTCTASVTHVGQPPSPDDGMW